jgi:hypothetical protein
LLHWPSNSSLDGFAVSHPESIIFLFFKRINHQSGISESAAVPFQPARQNRAPEQNRSDPAALVIKKVLVAGRIRQYKLTGRSVNLTAVNLGRGNHCPA